jgi:hypothetical protein
MGHSRQGRADGRSGDVGSLRFATDGRGHAKFRDVPKAEIIAVVRQPSVDALVDDCHGGHGNEDDGHERP